MSIATAQPMITEQFLSGEYPRKLLPEERKFLDWLLPESIPVYAAYLKKLDEYVILGEGRRGKGNLVVGTMGDVADTVSPLADVFAYGAIETSGGTIISVIREEVGGQIDVEIANLDRDEVLPEFEESRRWTYSLWNTHDTCPQCGKQPRIVPLNTALNERCTIAVCTFDKRLWALDEATKVKRLIPPTNFYNELMLHKKIRDPKIALDTKRLFSELSTFTDDDIVHAFFSYNIIHKKMNVEAPPVVKLQKPSLFEKLKRKLK